MILELNPLKWGRSSHVAEAPAAKPAAPAAAAQPIAPEGSMSVATVEKKFVSVLEAVGKDFEKGLAVAVKYLPAETTLASIIFPASAAPLTAATVTAELLQNSIVAAEQKYAASGAQSGTGTQKASEVLTLAGSAVTQLPSESQIASELKSAGITVDDSYISNLINAVVGVLNVQPAPTAALAA